ncbi:hypothetical protein FA15DRAFT_752391 [Coprinopsis marcescibilis]|uniref:F-box domain-containing protein n=1 Tax=Coprinopsis marcescibilis TaxID=230819 RepID=A0A5C3L961_COPMA|nr:hypothetical protein FA15DRAFT_752391 [Coprinopsis marcescibilis]
MNMDCMYTILRKISFFLLAMAPEPLHDSKFGLEGASPARTLSFSDADQRPSPDDASSSIINTLPVEILEQMFLSCHTSQNAWNNHLSIIGYNHHISPILLTQVCRLWRAICFGFPALWSSFTLCVRPTPLHDELVDIWLKRSRELPLDFDGAHAAKIPLSLGIVRELTAEARRWRTVCLNERAGLLQAFLDTLSPLDTPILECLTVKFSMWTEFAAFSEAFTERIGRLGSLKQLRLAIHGHLPERFFLALPFQQLTHINLTQVDVDYGVWILVLRRCERAVYVEAPRVMYFREGADGPPTHPVPGTSKWGGKNLISLPALLSLTLHTSVDVAKLQPYLVCPSLRVLRITEDRSVCKRHLELMESFISEGTPRLQHLFINDYSGSSSWENAQTYLRMEGVRKVGNVEVRVFHFNHCLESVQASGLARFRCPVAGCEAPHVGWSVGNVGHLGSGLGVGGVGSYAGTGELEIERPFWAAPHEEHVYKCLWKVWIDRHRRLIRVERPLEGMVKALL